MGGKEHSFIDHNEKSYIFSRIYGDGSMRQLGRNMKHIVPSKFPIFTLWLRSICLSSEATQAGAKCVVNRLGRLGSRKGNGEPQKGCQNQLPSNELHLTICLQIEAKFATYSPQSILGTKIVSFLSFFFFWPFPQHVEVPRPGIKPLLQR